MNQDIERAEKQGISTSKVKEYYVERATENIKNKMSAVFSAAGDSYGDIVSAYRTYLKKLDLNWFPGADIQKLKDIQKVQDDCLSFIEELKKIESNTNSILTRTEDS